MVAEAEEVINVLEFKQIQVEILKESHTKKIKCIYCEHVGRSICEVSQPWITYVVLLLLCLLVGWLSCCLFPFVLGILRRQIHRCPRCLNPIREESIFECLDDNILELSVCKFGILVKRRTLV